MKKRIIVVLFLVLLFGVSGLVYFGQKKKKIEEIYYSGTIEAVEANLSFQVSGRITDILVNEGQSVDRDHPLALLDQSEFLARYEQAKANLETARKGLQQAEVAFDISKKTLPAEVERAKAGVTALKAQLDELEAGYRVQDIEKARLSASALKATMDVARKDKERYDSLFQDKIVSEKEREAVDLRYQTALREYQAAKESLNQLSEGFRKEDIQTAKAKLVEGQALLNQARDNLGNIEVSQKEVEAARARLQAAEASVNLAETQLGFTRIKAPFKGIITSRNLEPGEVVTPGQEVFSLADLSSIKLKIFVDETEIGKVKPGQRVDVRIDTFPEKVYQGRVAFISPKGEFTPKIIQTHKERVKLVFMVKVLIPNPDLELKPGMPADAWLR